MDIEFDDADRGFFNYMPTVERVDEETQLTPITRLKNSPRPEKNEYAVIYDAGIDYLETPQLDAIKTFDLVARLTDARHDIWYSAIHNNASRNWQKVRIDAKFSEFCAEILGIHDVDAEIKNKTPDLMFYSRHTNTILIGDVTVTRAQSMADENKLRKYEPLAAFLARRTKCVIQHENFVVREDLSNLMSLVANFRNKIGLLSCAYNPIKDVSMTESANLLIQMLEHNCKERKIYNKLKESMAIRQNEPLSGAFKELLDPKLQEDIMPDYNPKMSENEIVAMIKKHVEEIGGSAYFDTDPKSIDDAFQNVLIDQKATHQKVKPPKSTIKVCDNSSAYNTKTDLELIIDYVSDIGHCSQSEVRDYILGLMPTVPQLNAMIKIRDKKIKKKFFKEHKDIIIAKVGGRYQYKRTKLQTNHTSARFESKVTEGSKKSGRPNTKEEVYGLDSDSFLDYISFIDKSIDYYGEISGKPGICDNSWDAANKSEADNTIEDRVIYDYVRKTNGAQICHSLSALFNRITHMSTSQGSYDNIFCPPNGSFIAIMPNNHAPVTSRNCDMPFIFLTRARINAQISHVEYEYKISSKTYTYYISKLCRLNIRTISCWDNAGYKLVASATYLLAKSLPLIKIKGKVVGLLTYLTIDVHQKVSEYLDLLKYIAFMPFADLHMLKHLIKDKCNLIMKTRMDVWIFNRLRMFVKELSDKDKLNASKPMVCTHNGNITRESLGIKMSLPSFFDTNVRHNNPEDFIEEMNVLNTSRPKHLYGSQFSDASTTKTAEWNIEFDEELRKYGTWATDGYGDGEFPFKSKFCFSADAIHYATLELENQVTCQASQVENKIMRSTYTDFMHTNCSLRGCTKEPKHRDNQSDIHTTSISACFERYREDNYKDDDARTMTIGQRFINSNDKMEFAMSEKDQRGSGRPIATPTLPTKAALMLIEKPEAEYGKFMRNNILVAGKDKLSEQHKAYTLCAAEGVRQKQACIFQLTEDQTKYSENDNTRKYVPYIQTNTMIPLSIRKIQLKALKKLEDRIHLIKRMPKSILESDALKAESVDDDTHLGVKVRIGWPQGMLNNLSTSIHCAADYWILKAFRKSYPGIQITVNGLVHSDDSWATICCNDVETFKLFTIFRTIAKRLFCLKINEKKLWGGRYLGELVSHYNLNGHVHMSTGKVICNGFSNLTYQNWPIDVSNQISTIQQAYRAGATIGNCILIATILRQQMLSAYQVSGQHKELLHKLPVELGGYPSGSVFRLAVSGIHAHYSDVHNYMTNDLNDDEHKDIIRQIVAAVTKLSIENYTPIVAADGDRLDLNEDDFVGIEIPTKGELFKAVKHIMPRSKKLAYAVKVVKETTDKFENDGLALIVTHPKTLAESIGHYGETAKTKQFELAAERYTQSSRKLAISQTLQSSGKVMRLNSSRPMTFNECIKVLLFVETTVSNLTTGIKSMESDNEVVIACDTIVKTASIEPSNTNKGKVINRMPEIENVYKTISPIQDVLLFKIDLTCGTNHLGRYGSNRTSYDTIRNDLKDLENRFKCYFDFFEVKTACKLIMQAKLATMKEKSWVQPKLNNDNLSRFLEDLYGSTLNKTINYLVKADRDYRRQTSVDEEAINDIYTTLMLNDIYPNKFDIELYDNESVNDKLNNTDIAFFSLNNKLKYGVCQKVYNNNPDYLKEIINAERFAYAWEKAQTMVNGRYMGDWCVYFVISDVVCKVSCIMNNISLTTNKFDVKKILKGMRLMTAKCFTDKSYEYDNAWWTSKLWCTNQREDMHADAYLCWINSYETMIKHSAMGGFINMYFDQSLKMKNLTIYIEPVDFEFTNNYRVIKALMPDNTGQMSSHRVSNIFQDLTIRDPSSIMLKYEKLNGFNTQDLLESKIIIDITLSRPISCTREQIIRLMNNNIERNFKITLWRFFYNLYCFYNKTPQYLAGTRFVDEDKPVSIGVDIELDNRNINKVDETFTQTKVESLESRQVEYVSEVVRLQPKVFKARNVLRILACHTQSENPPGDALDYLYGLLMDPNMPKLFDSVNQDVVDIINNTIGELDLPLCPDKLYYYILGNELDLTSTWDDININYLDPKLRNLGNVNNKMELIKQTIISFNNAYFDEELMVREPSLLDRYHNRQHLTNYDDDEPSDYDTD